MMAMEDGEDAGRKEEKVQVESGVRADVVSAELDVEDEEDASNRKEEKGHAELGVNVDGAQDEEDDDANAAATALQEYNHTAEALEALQENARVGDRVEVLWDDGNLYWGCVRSISLDNKLNVNYEDGSQESGVARSKIQRIAEQHVPELKAGTHKSQRPPTRARLSARPPPLNGTLRSTNRRGNNRKKQAAPPEFLGTRLAQQNWHNTVAASLCAQGAEGAEGAGEGEGEGEAQDEQHTTPKAKANKARKAHVGKSLANVKLLVAKIMTYIASHPISAREDVACLKQCFNGNWEQFVTAWALREPVLVRRYYATPSNRTVRYLKLKGGYKFLPTRCVKYMKPSQIAQWSPTLVREVACTLQEAVESLNLDNYYQFKRVARKVPGIGQYSTEHLFRTALLMVDKRHPCVAFVVMGTGASNRKYDTFRHHGINNLAAFNACAHALGYTQLLDGGELAYALCMIGDL